MSRMVAMNEHHGVGVWLPRLEILSGADLRWWGLAVSLGQFRLLSEGAPGGPWEIRFVGTRYLDLPVVMHRVSFFPPTAQDTARMLACLHPAVRAHVPRDQQLAVECDEGRFSISACGVYLYPSRETDRRFVEEIERSLWPGGVAEHPRR